MFNTGTSVVLIAVCCCLLPALVAATNPHIVFIVADDLGWNDVGWVNSDIQTPNLDSMAANAILLNYSYVQAVCTPSRSAFLSGYYPLHTGLQVGSIASKQPKYLPNKFTLLPEKLQDLGYETHMVGKWHLGFCNWTYTPSRRGFDSFVGFFNGHEGYYDHKKGTGYDFWFNETIYSDTYTDNKYATEIFSERAVDIIQNHDPNGDPLFLYLAFNAPHTPQEVPTSYLDMYNSTPGLSTNRKTFSAMVTALDAGIGDIKDALQTYGYMDNTIIIFTSDNGGQPNGGGNNYPLRGTKGTYWEGGTRVPAFVYSTVDEYKGVAPYTSSELFHAVDWYPTILSMAGADASVWNGVDGKDQWDVLRYNNDSVRDYVIYNKDLTIYDYAAVRSKTYKLVVGDISPDSTNDNIIDVASTRRKRSLEDDIEEEVRELEDILNNMEKNPQMKFKRAVTKQLFRIDTDESESTDLLSTGGDYSSIVSELEAVLDGFTEVTPQNPATTSAADPVRVGGIRTWYPEWCETDTLYT